MCVPKLIIITILYVCTIRACVCMCMYVVSVLGVGVVETAGLGPAVIVTVRVRRAEVTVGAGVGVTVVVGAGVEAEVEEGGWVITTMIIISMIIRIITIIMAIIITIIIEAIIEMIILQEEETIFKIRTRTKIKTKMILLRYPIIKIILFLIIIQRANIALTCNRKVHASEVISVGIHMI